MCFLCGRGALFQQIEQKFEKRVLRVDGADEKEQIVHIMHSLKVVVHAVVSSVGLLEAKNGPGTSESKSFHGCMEGKIPNRTNKGAIGAKKVR